MCGIAGFVFGHEDRPRQSLKEIAHAMGQALQHRGPDDAGVWSDNNIGIGLSHQRLSIIDLSQGGHQPMASSCGRFIIVYNGEIYNYKDIRQQLSDRGRCFKSDSDSEVVVEALAEWGVERSLKKFIGMFAFALWDKQDRKLVLARDRLGIKPMYWGVFNGSFIFASELKAFHKHPSCHLEINRNALASYLRHTCVPGPHSIYQNIQKLEPGHFLTYEQGQNSTLTTFWNVCDYVDQKRWVGTDDQAADQLERLIEGAVRLRMISDAPIGAFLSGGIDSSLVVAMMQKQSSQPIKTYTVGFDEAGYDESSDGASIARHLGTDHHELRISPAEAMSVISKMGTIYDEPFADSSQIPTYLISKFARSQVTVCLSGDGGDELMAGYNRHVWAGGPAKRLAQIPLAIRQLSAKGIKGLSPSMWDALASSIPKNKRPKQFGDKLHKLAHVMALNDINAQYDRLVSHWADPSSVVLGGAELENRWNASALNKGLNPLPLSRMQLRDTLGYLPDDILTKVDRASMAVSLETRVPLLDHRLIEFSWGLPDHLKCRQGQGKWLLRKVLARHVPPQMFERPKTGFAIPIGSWLRGPLKDWAADLLSETRLTSEGYFDPKPIAKIWQDHQTGRLNADSLLWSVLMFQTWLDNQSKENG